MACMNNNNKKIRFLFTALLIHFLTAIPVMAHHSRANFQLDEVITIEGVVRDYSWKNPHVYMEIEVSGENNQSISWLIESHSLTGLRKLGWDRGSFKAGDQVVVVGNPDRNSERRFLLMDHIIRDNGETLYSFRRPDNDTSKKTPIVSKSSDFSGTWTRVASLKFALTGGFNPPRDWPLTERGRAQVNRFDLDDNPEYDCLPIGMPRVILYPYLIRWSRHADRIEIEKEHTNIRRAIYLDTDKHPEDIKPSNVGHSIGRFDGNGDLLVDTVGFLPLAWGNSAGLDSSDQKHVTERYTLTDDGLGMDVSYTLVDPEFLSEPVTVTGRYRKVPDIPLEPYSCDRETARRHLNVNKK